MRINLIFVFLWAYMPKTLPRSNSARSSGDEGMVEDDGAKDPKHTKDRAKAGHKECKESAKAQREKDALAAAAKVNNYADFSWHIFPSVQHPLLF